MTPNIFRLTNSARMMQYRFISRYNRCLKDASYVPLTEPLNIEVNSGIKPRVGSPKRDTKISRLSNGLRVCSEPNFGDFVTIGVAIQSGCRYEHGFPAGTTRMVEKMAFSASKRFPSREDVFEILENSGGIIDCQSTRDTFIYAASCHRSAVDSVNEILANAVWRPLLSKEVIEETAQMIHYENMDMARKIEAIEPFLADFIHQAAFQANTLGFPKYVPLEDAEKVKERHIASYLCHAHAPQRMVIGGVGVDHQEFVESVERHFDLSKCTWNEDQSLLIPSSEIDQSIAQYTGGEVRRDADLSVLTVGTPYPLLSHVVLGFEGCSFKDEDFVPFCVLQSLLGGGGAFSAGGPGKGMYARLYTDVMNRHHWIYSAIANNYSYDDTGLFTITASCEPAQVNDALIVMMDQFIRLRNGTDKQELERAKTQLRSHLMMNLEVRPVLFEDMVRQLLGHDERRRPEEYAEKIAKVSNNDIMRIADRMLSSKPSVAGYGNINKLSNYSKVDESVAKRSCMPLMQ